MPNPRDPRTEGFIPSYSFLKLFDGAIAPCKILHKRLTDKEKEAKEGMPNWKKESNAIDCSILRPDDFDKEYTIGTCINEDTITYKFCRAIAEGKSVKEAKEISDSTWKIETLQKKVLEGGEWVDVVSDIQARLHDPRTVLSPEMYDNIQKLCDKVMSPPKHGPWIGDYLNHPEVEIEKRSEWVDKASGVKCLGYKDITLPHMIIDLKTAENAAPGAYNRRYGLLGKYGYIEQLVAYAASEGWIDEHFMLEDGKGLLIYMIEKVEPYPVAVYEPSIDDIMSAGERFSIWCQKYKHIQENDLWGMGYEYSAMFNITCYEVEQTSNVKGIHKTEIYQGIY